jgi:hypothetical protein
LVALIPPFVKKVLPEYISYDFSRPNQQRQPACEQRFLHASCHR